VELGKLRMEKTCMRGGLPNGQISVCDNMINSMAASNSFLLKPSSFSIAEIAPAFHASNVIIVAEVLPVTDTIELASVDITDSINSATFDKPLPVDTHITLH
jgi:hypothetical protein